MYHFVLSWGNFQPENLYISDNQLGQCILLSVSGSMKYSYIYVFTVVRCCGASEIQEFRFYRANIFHSPKTIVIQSNESGWMNQCDAVCIFFRCTIHVGMTVRWNDDDVVVVILVKWKQISENSKDQTLKCHKDYKSFSKTKFEHFQSRQILLRLNTDFEQNNSN